MKTPNKHGINQQLSFTGMITESNDEQTSPSAKARRRWRQAIEQQILLGRLEKENQSVISKWMGH